MDLQEINRIIDEVEVVLNDEVAMNNIKGDTSTLNRAVSVFNMIVEKAQNDNDLPNPAGGCSVD